MRRDRASELSLLRVLASRVCNAAAGSTLGQPWVNLPQASDSLDAIAALFRVSSGVGLCARVSLRGPSRRRRSRESARERARARPSPRTSIQKNSYPLSFLRFRVLLFARATPEAPPEAGSGAEKRRFNAPHLARPRVARAAARRSNDARFDARLFFFFRDASATTAPSRARVAECRGALARVRGRVTRSRRRDETSHGGMTKKTHVKKFLRRQRRVAENARVAGDRNFARLAQIALAPGQDAGDRAICARAAASRLAKLCAAPELVASKRVRETSLEEGEIVAKVTSRRRGRDGAERPKHASLRRLVYTPWFNTVHVIVSTRAKSQLFTRLSEFVCYVSIVGDGVRRGTSVRLARRLARRF